MEAHHRHHKTCIFQHWHFFNQLNSFGMSLSRPSFSNCGKPGNRMKDWITCSSKLVLLVFSLLTMMNVELCKTGLLGFMFHPSMRVTIAVGMALGDSRAFIKCSWMLLFGLLQLLRGKENECPEIFDEADCFFFARTGDFYIAPPKPLLTFQEAEFFCRDLGGNLAEIDEPSEEDLLAGLASNAGSWVGLTRDDESGKWAWKTSGVEVPEDSDIWVFMADLKSKDKSCATLDRRGVRHSVHPEECSMPTRAICEFSADSAPDACKVSWHLRNISENMYIADEWMSMNICI